jgi:hypothetical protein
MLVISWVCPPLGVRSGPGYRTIGSLAVENTPVTPGLLAADSIWDETAAAVVRVPQAA